MPHCEFFLTFLTINSFCNVILQSREENKLYNIKFIFKNLLLLVLTENSWKSVVCYSNWHIHKYKCTYCKEVLFNSRYNNNEKKLASSLLICTLFSLLFFLFVQIKKNTKTYFPTFYFGKKNVWFFLLLELIFISNMYSVNHFESSQIQYHQQYRVNPGKW